MIETDTDIGYAREAARGNKFDHELQEPWGNGGFMFYDKCLLCGSPATLGVCESKVAKALLEAQAVEAERWSRQIYGTSGERAAELRRKAGKVLNDK